MTQGPVSLAALYVTHPLSLKLSSGAHYGHWDFESSGFQSYNLSKSTNPFLQQVVFFFIFFNYYFLSVYF